jgi:hypothetical protein
MSGHDLNPDGPLTPEQIAIAASLTTEEVQAIDEVLMSNVSTRWRKIARVVGTTMNDALPRKSGLPDVFFAHRIRKLVESGQLEYQGMLENMRYCEIRLP